MTSKFNMVWFIITFLFCTTGSAIILKLLDEDSLIVLFGLSLLMMMLFMIAVLRQKRRR